MARTRTEAPGLLRVKRPNRTVHYWSAARACKRPEAQAYQPRTVPLLQDDEEGRAAQCRLLTAELLEWIAQQAEDPSPSPARRYDGTINSLNRIYESHPESPFHSVGYATRQVYVREIKPLLKAVGERRVDLINGADLRSWHAKLAKPAKEGGAPRIRRAQGCMKALRRIVKWGHQLRLTGCAELREILSDTRFAIPAARDMAPSYEQIVAFIAAAHEAGRPSMAMAAALMYDAALRQTDVIGKWEPAAESPRQGGYIHAGRRWGGGVLWQDIREGILSKRTTKTGSMICFAIAGCPLVTAEIANVPEEKRIGPLVVDEQTGRPYRHRWFAAIWRKIARQAGIPDGIWSRDTRAGAITEAFDAGANPEHVRVMATHSDPKMTSRYNKGSAKQTSAVAQLRAAHRVKGTE
jgi:hypothetical protein